MPTKMSHTGYPFCLDLKMVLKKKKTIYTLLINVAKHDKEKLSREKQPKCFLTRILMGFPILLLAMDECFKVEVKVQLQFSRIGSSKKKIHLI